MTTPPSRSDPRAQLQRRIVDAHLHPLVKHPADSPYSGWNLDEKEYVDYLDRCGIRRGVVHAVVSPESTTADGMISANREALRFLDKYPGRFAAACAVDFRFIDESLREIEDWKKRHGMVWVAEFEFHLESPPSLPDMDRIMEQIEQLGMIVSISTGPEGVAWLVHHHSDATIVFPQLELGGVGRDYSRIAVAGKPQNFHLDISPRGYERMGLIEEAVEWVGPAKLIFGSNFPINSPAAVIARLDNAFLPEADKQAIFSSNIELLLNRAGWRFRGE